MGKLIYLVTVSLDGYVADPDGSFEFTAPSEEVHAFINDLVRPTGTFLFGRRMYDVMAVWEDLPLEGEPEVMRDFAGIWHGADKVVYSRTLDEPRTARTRIAHEFDADEVRTMKDEEHGDLGIGGPELAGQAVRAGLVDELHLFLVPIVVGGGTAVLPRDVRWDLELTDERRFDDGRVYLRYRPRSVS